ncbi:MAG: hypothetical protein DRN04_07540 [Thermoprotei archaeon]|nr:MAG: hypothetical protein DRN04_07540 [Thermoprotei archaeon]
MRILWCVCFFALYLLASPALIKFMLSIPGYASLFPQKTLSEVKQSLSIIEEEYRKESVKEQEYRPMIVEVKEGEEDGEETLVYEEDTQVYG